jgi:hypothetical protein
MSFDPGPFAIEPVEAMSLGLAVVAVSGNARSRPAGLVTDGHNGFVIPHAKPDRCRDVLAELAGDADRRREMRGAAYATGRALSVDIEGVCERFSDLLDGMLAELRSGRYAKPAPIFHHPAFGGLSLPPALQFDPDKVMEESAAPSADEGGPAPAGDVAATPLQRGWAPVFDLAGEGPQPLARGAAKLRWQDRELEIAAADGNAGIVIDLDSNHSHRLMLRMALRAEEAGYATVLSQTIAETECTNVSRIRHALKPGLNDIKIDIARDASVRAVRIDPGERMGLWRLQRLTILAPASAAREEASILPMVRLVDFRSDGNADEYLAGTWYAPEPELRWTCAGGGEVRFVPEFPDKGEARLWVLCRVAGTAALGDLHVAPKLGNGAVAEKWAFHDDGWQLKSVVLTRPMPGTRPVVRINFHRDDTESMASLGLSPDPRELGVGVRKMGIFADSAPIGAIEAAFRIAPDEER